MSSSTDRICSIKNRQPFAGGFLLSILKDCKETCTSIKRVYEEMNPHFFTAPFYFAFIWFRVQGSGGGFAAFFRRWYSRIAAFPSR